MKKIIVMLLVGMILISFASAIVTVCCEKTKSGAWCQNVPEDECASGSKQEYTSCDNSAYCALGCCYNNFEGTCLQNTPQQVCQDGNGLWNEDSSCNIPQCSLGCCLMGDQAAFVTKVRCKKLSALYGLEINFRTDLSNEIQCIAATTSKVKGACVYDDEYFTRTCEFITQEECKTRTSSSENESEFYANILCSNEELETDCGYSRKTTLVDGKDGVYFLDTCGNIANIYDSSKAEDQTYWNYVYSRSESCNPDSANIGSKSCGNCDYFKGSVGMNAKTAKDIDSSIGTPNMGDYICANLGCNDADFKKDKGRNPLHGETWCVSNAKGGYTDGTGLYENLPGARYFRFVCYNGAITVEPCAEYRKEICIEEFDEERDFSYANCRVNRFQDCTAQTTKDECEDTDYRDCEWNTWGIKPKFIETDDEGDEKLLDNESVACFPKYTPGYDFWQSTEAEGACSAGVSKCVVECEKKLGSGWDCDNGDPSGCGDEDDTTDMWEEDCMIKCNKFGDCGNSYNYLGIMSNDNGFTVSKETKKD